MVRNSTRSIPYILSSDKGFTLPELLMASFLGLLLTSSVMAVSNSYRNILGQDIARTRLNQNLRGAMDIMGFDIRVAGENLGSAFPAVEIVNGATDELVVRRNLLDEVLPVCTSITAGSTVTNIYFAVSGNPPGCAYSGHTTNYNAWRNYRIAQGGTVQAFVFNTTTKLGEFFNYVSETDTGTQYYVTRSAGSWANAYPSGASAVYILEEWRYRVSGGLLQVVQNRDTANPFNVAFDLTNFQVSALMQDGTTRTSFGTADQWTSLSALQLSLSGTDRYRGEVMNRTLSANFFPRNILSN